MYSESKEESVEVGVLGSESKLKSDVSEEAILLVRRPRW